MRQIFPAWQFVLGLTDDSHPAAEPVHDTVERNGLTEQGAL
jgi:hypothetical protein